MLKSCMLKIILKFTLAIALLYWLVSSGKLDFSLVSKSFEVGPQWLIAYLTMISIAVIGAYRYKLLLEIKSSSRLPFLKVLSLNYIGLFFSSALPGGVTGDLIKMIYIKKLDKEFNNTFLVTATLLDRIIGLSGLLFMAGFFSIIYFSKLSSLSPKISQLLFVNLFLFGGTIIFLGILISPYKAQKIIINLFLKFPMIGKKIADLLEQIFSLRENKKNVVICYMLSVFTHLLSILAFWTICSPFYTGHLPFQYVFTLIPVGLISVAIPISPGGLGVGHVVFENLFSLINIKNGASFFNLFYLCNLCENLLGVIPYLIEGRKTVKAKEAL